eukprot:CAMPEP_0183303502 /NCGR_PEP_ID=MMETSP0160_2-20130417/8916_1 /TAXON_ID=2839 ORGANISM="Odontella Sinensis, Strain Grunow 1884" /NCGR_SAMPLE_ID=MMETSP0160_2 /ASSEMBLY_ACC=CAM_ASM_000250 /LENGTH=254 /DNA_ID=CAMNT_0025466415 /DNA_START=52 /DNA_END=817 /DNA_ORIENTATION=-
MAPPHLFKTLSDDIRMLQAERGGVRSIPRRIDAVLQEDSVGAGKRVGRGGEKDGGEAGGAGGSDEGDARVWMAGEIYLQRFLGGVRLHDPEPGMVRAGSIYHFLAAVAQHEITKEIVMAIIHALEKLDDQTKHALSGGIVLIVVLRWLLSGRRQRRNRHEEDRATGGGEPETTAAADGAQRRRGKIRRNRSRNRLNASKKKGTSAGTETTASSGGGKTAMNGADPTSATDTSESESVDNVPSLSSTKVADKRKQ